MKILLLQTLLNQSSEKSVVESGFEPGKKNFLHLTDKDGEQPQIVLVRISESYQDILFLFSLCSVICFFIML